MASASFPDVLNALGNNVLTDLTIGDAEALYGLVNGVDPATIEHISIDDTNFLYDCGYPSRCGSYYLFANDQSFKSLSHFVQDIFPTPAALADGAHVTFLNASGRNNNATTRWASLMHMVGFSTTAGGQGTDPGGHPGDRQQRRKGQPPPRNGSPRTSASASPPSRRRLRAATTPPATPAAAAAGGVTVILGSAEEQAFLGDPGLVISSHTQVGRRVEQRIAVLTGGGDAPGLNAAIRAIGRRAIAAGDTLFGIRNGWAGLLGDSDVIPLERPRLSGILPLGGTMLGSSRVNPMKLDDGVDEVLQQPAAPAPRRAGRHRRR